MNSASPNAELVAKLQAAYVRYCSKMRQNPKAVTIWSYEEWLELSVVARSIINEDYRP